MAGQGALEDRGALAEALSLLPIGDEARGNILPRLRRGEVTPGLKSLLAQAGSLPPPSEAGLCEWCQRQRLCAFGQPAPVVVCALCRGSGRVLTFATRREVDCPNCFGDGAHVCRCLGCHPAVARTA